MKLFLIILGLVLVGIVVLSAILSHQERRDAYPSGVPHWMLGPAKIVASVSSALRAVGSWMGATQDHEIQSLAQVSESSKAAEYLLMGKPVSREEYDRFREGLKVGSGACEEFTNGGATRAIGTDKDGVQYDVYEGSIDHKGFGEITIIKK